MSGRLQPAVLGGLFIGVLSALPFVQAGNCCCCLWVVLGGVLAAYLRQQTLPAQIDAAEGALVGLAAGALGGIVAAVLSIPVQRITGPILARFIEQLLVNPDVPSEFRDIFADFLQRPEFRVAEMLITIVVFSVFGLFGGLLGVALFKKSGSPLPPPPGTMEVLPPE